MTLNEIAQMIAGVGLPYAYYQFRVEDAPQSPPFICFYYSGDNDFIADNINYKSVNRLVIELYADNVDFEHEHAIEAALRAADLPYSRDQVYIDGERMFQTSYNVEVCINAE